jgi:hypothetical protein
VPGTKRPSSGVDELGEYDGVGGMTTVAVWDFTGTSMAVVLLRIA